MNQNLEVEEAEKKMPSTAAKATRRSAKVDRYLEIHPRLGSQSILRLTQEMPVQGVG